MFQAKPSEHGAAFGGESASRGRRETREEERRGQRGQKEGCGGCSRRQVLVHDVAGQKGNTGKVAFLRNMSHDGYTETVVCKMIFKLTLLQVLEVEDCQGEGG